jgi:hypothetical protein
MELSLQTTSASALRPNVNGPPRHSRSIGCPPGGSTRS